MPLENEFGLFRTLDLECIAFFEEGQGSVG